MPSAGKINKELKKTFEGAVQAHIEDGKLILTGELERWNQVVSAGMIAAGAKLKKIKIVNNIECTGSKPIPIRVPRVEDTQLDGQEVDVLIIGGGIIGCAIAREFSKYSKTVLLVEKENDIGLQASSHSTGIVHSGIKLRSGTMKQWYTKLGNQKLEEICNDLGVPFRRTGQYIVSKKSLWTPFMILSKLYWRLYGIKDIQLVKGYEIKEPGISQKLSTTLYSPSGGVVDPHLLTIAYAENSVQNGVHISLNTIVNEMSVEEGKIKTVTTNRGVISPKLVINAAGLFCEDIAEMADDKFYSIRPVKGTHVVFDKKYTNSITSSVVSLHGKAANGKNSSENMHSVAQTVHGNVIAGPFLIEARNKEDYTSDKFSVDKAVANARYAFPTLDLGHIIKYYAGTVGATYDGDFIVSQGKNVSNMIHAAGIQFPGITASPAIAEAVVQIAGTMISGYSTVDMRADFNPKREAPPKLTRMSLEAQDALINENPDYGITVCYCEKVSRGEIAAALQGNIGCETVNGVKRRTRAGCGSCQGTHCTPLVVDIIAAEKKLPPSQIKHNGKGSELVFGTSIAIEKPKDNENLKPHHYVPALFSEDSGKHSKTEEKQEGSE